MIARNRKPQRGYSLVEMLAVMATMTLVLGLCVALLEMILKLHSSGMQHIENEAAIARMARVFRNDVRSATEVTRCAIGKNSTTLGLSIGGESVIEYQVIKDSLLRSEWREDELVGQEQFRLPKTSSARFEHRESGGLDRVALVLERRGKTGQGEARSRPFQVEATRGANFRFELAGETTR